MDNKTCQCSLGLSGCQGEFLLGSSFVISKDEFFGPHYLSIMDEWKERKSLEVSEKVRIINLIRQKILRFPIHKPICPECAMLARQTLGKRVTVQWHRIKPIRISARRAYNSGSTGVCVAKIIKAAGLAAT